MSPVNPNVTSPIFAPQLPPAALAGIPAAPPATPFVPQFLQDVTISVTIPDLGEIAIRENPYYFATSDTADYMVKRFVLLGAVAITIDYGAGYKISQPQEMVVLPNGKLYNAGLLAWYFLDRPDDQAAALVNTAIANLLARKNG